MKIRFHSIFTRILSQLFRIYRKKSQIKRKSRTIQSFRMGRCAKICTIGKFFSKISESDFIYFNFSIRMSWSCVYSSGCESQVCNTASCSGHPGYVSGGRHQLEYISFWIYLHLYIFSINPIWHEGGLQGPPLKSLQNAWFWCCNDPQNV